MADIPRSSWSRRPKREIELGLDLRVFLIKINRRRMVAIELPQAVKSLPLTHQDLTKYAACCIADSSSPVAINSYKNTRLVVYHGILHEKQPNAIAYPESIDDVERSALATRCSILLSAIAKMNIRLKGTGETSKVS